MANRGKQPSAKTSGASSASRTARTAKAAPAPAKRVAKKAGAPRTNRATAKATAPKMSTDLTGVAGRDEALAPRWAQSGERLTTATGLRVPDTDNSLTAGERGPTLIEDHHAREKVMHFDHERIPERVVHARGAGAHGVFRLNTSLAEYTCAQFLCDVGTEVPVFVRFSTVVGSRGSADTVRDVRGFATKFYTPQGNFDLVGNNIPVFFIQDGIKFPDIVHAAKPEQDREIPQAQTAHDTFWDFVSLTPESTHMLMWTMSDRAIPRSYRMMEGFGVHTFRLVAADGSTTLAKFHWKPVAGVHGLVWEEAQMLAGVDPDFHRRDLWNSIESGAYPEWELGVQLIEDDGTNSFAGIDLLDSTKIVPEELVPVTPVGRLTLNRNPSNFFAETEQVAFHVGHLVPGIDVTDDPLLHMRLFSYLDTQLTRLGGPNFDQLPINRPAAPVNDNLRDGFSQQAIHQGRSAHSPTSLAGGCPFAAADPTAFIHVPRAVHGEVGRRRAVSFDDHYSQATLFWASMTPVEQEHIVGAFAFELGKCDDDAIVDRMLANLANVDDRLVAEVAARLGRAVPAPAPSSHAVPDATASEVSGALSMVVDREYPLDGRMVAIMAADGLDGLGVARITKSLGAVNATVHVVGPHGGELMTDRGGPVTAVRTQFTSHSVEYDAVVLAGGSGSATLDTPNVARFVQEAFRHHKTIAAWGEAAGLLAGFGIAEDGPGVVTSAKADAAFASAIEAAMALHRHWERS